MPPSWFYDWRAFQPMLHTCTHGHLKCFVWLLRRQKSLIIRYWSFSRHENLNLSLCSLSLFKYGPRLRSLLWGVVNVIQRQFFCSQAQHFAATGKRQIRGEFKKVVNMPARKSLHWNVIISTFSECICIHTTCRGTQVERKKLPLWDTGKMQSKHRELSTHYTGKYFFEQYVNEEMLMLSLRAAVSNWVMSRETNLDSHGAHSHA